jgi:multimeric flavodoxin WrbA
LNAVVSELENSGIETEIIRLGDAKIGFCTGCKTCDKTGECVQHDDMGRIMSKIYAADIVVVASPSYWGDVTAQMKQFIDRCTPFCNNNANRQPIPTGKCGAAIAIRAGQNKKENEHLLATIEHFLGHLDIPLQHRFTIEGIKTREDLAGRPAELERARAFGREIIKHVI